MSSNRPRVLKKTQELYRPQARRSRGAASNDSPTTTTTTTMATTSSSSSSSKKIFRPRQPSNDEQLQKEKAQKAKEYANKQRQILEEKRKEEERKKELERLRLQEIAEAQKRMKELEEAKKLAQMHMESYEKEWEKRMKLRESNKMAYKKHRQMNHENEEDDEDDDEDNNNKKEKKGKGNDKKEKRKDINSNINNSNKKGETNIKKIQAFLKKIKGFNEPSNLKNVQSIIKEMSTYKLDHYLKEIIRDLSTAPINNDPGEIEALVALVSAFYQMYDKFGKKFKDAILDIFNPKSHKISSASSADLFARQKINLHIITELVYVDVIEKSCIPSVIKHMLRLEQKHKTGLIAKHQQLISTDMISEGGMGANILHKNNINSGSQSSKDIDDSVTDFLSGDHRNNLSKLNNMGNKSSSGLNPNDDDEAREGSSKNYQRVDRQNVQKMGQLLSEHDDFAMYVSSLIADFLEYGGEECAGYVSTSLRHDIKILNTPISMNIPSEEDLVDEAKIPANDDKFPQLKECLPRLHGIFTLEEREQLQKEVNKYFEAVCDKYQKFSKKLRKQLRQNEKIILERGDISEERKAITERLRVVTNELKKCVNQMCERMGREFPQELPDSDDEEVSTLLIDGKETTLEEAKQQSYFDNEDMIAFYQHIPDLSAMFPGSLLQGDNDVRKMTSMDEKKDEKIEIDMAEEIPDELPAYLNETTDMDEVDVSEEQIDIAAAAAASDGTNVNEDALSLTTTKQIKSIRQYLAALSMVGSRSEADKLAEQFCNLNQRKNRKKLAVFLATVDKSHLNRIPFFGRLIATLHKCGINVSDRVVLMLEKDFYQIIYKKGLQDEKQKILTYISELVKFNIWPSKSVFQIIQRLLKKFNTDNIELITTLFQGCGRYLYRNPFTTLRLQSVLKFLQDKKMERNLDALLKFQLDAAIYACQPPQASALMKGPSLTYLQRYIRYLICQKLTQENKQMILKQLRKLPWDEPETRNFIIGTLFDVRYLQFDRIDAVAAICSGLDVYHGIAPEISDAILEEIRLGLEESDFSQNQHRLTYMKYLGELYAYKIVNSDMIFDTLYLLIRFGLNAQLQSIDINKALQEEDVLVKHFGYRKLEGEESKPFVSQTDWGDVFRIQCVCQLLETCSSYYTKRLKSRYDRFLLYFQQFVMLKQPIPIDVEWWVDEMLEKYQHEKIQKWEDLQMTISKFEEAEMVDHNTTLLQENQEDVDKEEEAEIEAEMEEDVEEDVEEEEEEENEELEDGYHRREALSEFDKDFLSEYEKLMTGLGGGDAGKPNKVKRSSTLKHASMLVDQLESQLTVDTNDSNKTKGETEKGMVKFNLVTKKGVTNLKTKVGIITVPKNAEFIKQRQATAQQQKKQKDAIKDITLEKMRQNEGQSGDEEEYSGEDEDGNEYIAEVENREREMGSKNAGIISGNRYKKKYNKQRDREKDKEKVKKYERPNKIAQSLADTGM